MGLGYISRARSVLPTASTFGSWPRGLLAAKEGNVKVNLQSSRVLQQIEMIIIHVTAIVAHYPRKITGVSVAHRRCLGTIRTGNILTT
jgi:hypothetical protein